MQDEKAGFIYTRTGETILLAIVITLKLTFQVNSYLDGDTLQQMQKLLRDRWHLFKGSTLFYIYKQRIRSLFCKMEVVYVVCLGFNSCNMLERKPPSLNTSSENIFMKTSIN